ncbi:hypothetical protein BST61_g2614 [Cercospora zeina]
MAGCKWSIAAATILSFVLAVEGCNKCENAQADNNVITVVVHASCGVPSKTTTLWPPPTPPSVTDVPPCARDCVMEGQYGGCAEGDVKCICRNRSYLEGLTGCVSRKCTGRGDCQGVVDFAKRVCGSVGITDIPMPSCAPPPPSVTDVPSCAQKCVVQGSYGGCREGDVTCICRNTPYLQDLTGCVTRECTGTSCQDVVDFAKNICGNVGVTSLPMPSCAASTTSVRPPTVTDVPSCAQVCLTPGSYGGCSEGDVNCICRNTAYLNGLTDCVSRNCNTNGCAQVASFAGNLCSSVGVTSLPLPSSCGIPPVTFTTTQPTVVVTTAPGQTVTTTAPTTVIPPAQTVTASTAITVTVISTAPPSTISVTETYRATTTQQGPTETTVFVSTIQTTVERTLTLPASSYTTTIVESGTTVTQVTTLPASTVVETVVSLIPTTVLSIPPPGTETEVTIVQQTVVSTAPGETVTATYQVTSVQVSTAQGETVTAPGETIIATAPGETIVSTAPGATIVSTAPGETIVTTAPGETIVSTAPGETIVSTAPAETIVSTILSTIITTAPGETVVSTYISTYRSTIISTAPAQTTTEAFSVTQTIPASTVTVTSVTTPPPVTVTVSTSIVQTTTQRTSIIQTTTQRTTVSAEGPPPGYAGPTTTTTTTTTTPLPPGYVGPTTTRTTTTTTTRTSSSSSAAPPPGGYP